MNNKDKIELAYRGKEPERQIINKKLSYTLEKVKSFGNLRLDGWENMLIFGDNLTALRLLYQNPSIKGKVRLIYIDPPFSTNQIYNSWFAHF